MEVDRFHELNAFIAVVEAGGFTAAAHRTGDSQSAISKAIGALERRLGLVLFNRSTRRVTLTDQGQRYYDRAKPLLDEMDDAVIWPRCRFVPARVRQVTHFFAEAIPRRI